MTRKEDIVYSLLGIFNINILLIYGEGREKAFKRLREEIKKALKGRSSYLVIGIFKYKVTFKD